MKRIKLTRKQKIQIRKERIRTEYSKTKFNSGVILIIVGFIFFLFLGNLWVSRNDKIDNKELKTLYGNVSGKFEKEWTKTVGKLTNFKLEEYPNTQFKVGRFGSYSLDINSINDELEKQNGIEIQILDKDWNKIGKNKTVFVYGIIKNKTEYLSVSTYNRLKKEDRNSLSIYALLLGSTWLIGYGLNLIIKNRVPADNIMS